MPSLNLTNKSLRYSAADESAIDKAATLLAVMAEYDPAAKQDANTALLAMKALQKHVSSKRAPAVAATK